MIGILKPEKGAENSIFTRGVRQKKNVNSSLLRSLIFRHTVTPCLHWLATTHAPIANTKEPFNVRYFWPLTSAQTPTS